MTYNYGLAYGLLALAPFMMLLELGLDRLSRHRKSGVYHKTMRKGVEGLKALSWQDFEHFCAGYFKKKGYSVKMMGLGGADDGMDLLVKRNGKEAVVQCKHWKGRVGVGVVREMYGLMHANNHEQIFIVALSGYTKAAFEWAKGKPIRLITGYELVKNG